MTVHLLQNSEDELEEPIYFFTDESLVCIKESDTIICGKLETFDYKELEEKFTFEPFFGECDLFGF